MNNFLNYSKKKKCIYTKKRKIKTKINKLLFFNYY